MRELPPAPVPLAELLSRAFPKAFTRAFTRICTRALIDGQGTWGAVAARLYDALVARGQQALYDELLDATGAVDLPAGSEVLDVGAGPGHAALRLAARAPGLCVVGVDSSREMVRLAERRARASAVGDRVRFVDGDALALPFPPEHFDAALSLASIKHWPDRARGMAELHRVLKPGARAVIIEADRDASDATLADYAARWPWLPISALLRAYRGYIARGSINAAEARALLDGSPFRGGEIAPLKGTPLLVLRARRA